MKLSQFNEKKDSILSEIEIFKYVLTLYKKNLSGEEESGKKFYPEMIIIYRDGVGEGQLD